MSGKVRGVVCVLGDTKTFGDKGFRKRELVLEQERGSFTNYVPLDLTRDTCDLADELRIGDEIEAHYQLGGRKWQKDASSEVRYFLSAEVTAFSVLGGAPKSTSSRSNTDTVSGYQDNDEAPF